MSQLRFDGRVAIVTGAARGLGRAYALLLGSLGAKVIVNDTGGSVAGGGVDAAPAQSVVNEIIAGGGEAAVCTDTVATPEGGKAIIEAALDQFGRIDILIHNAGNFRSGWLKDYDQKDYDEVVAVHQGGAYHTARPAFELMVRQGFGRVVLTSSICGVYGCLHNISYAVSKTAMIGLNNIIALEGAKSNVTSNIILPAAVTRMAGEWDFSTYPPMNEDQVAPMVGWLSHESCSVSGEIYAAIGGRMAKVYLNETRGVYEEAWTIDKVAAQIDAIRDMADPKHFPILPAGHDEHIKYSFEMGYGQTTRKAG